jgi:hypothetical protein
MYKNNSLNLFVNTESDNISSEFDLLKNLQKETKQNNNLKNNDISLSPTSTDISQLKNNISLSSTSDNTDTQKKSYLSNVLQKHIKTSTNSTTSEMNTTDKNKVSYSTTSSDTKDSSPFINTKQKKHDYLIQEPIDFNSETSEYKPPLINYDNMIKSTNNNANNNTNNITNNNTNKERTLNLTSIFNNVIGMFTYLFTIDNSKSNDDDDRDII